MHPNAPMRDASLDSGASASRAGWPRRIRRALLLAILGSWIITAYWQTHKPLPEGTRLATPWYALPANESRFLADVTTADGFGNPVLSQTIFDEVLSVVRSAEQFVVLDYFLFNEQRGTLADSRQPLRSLATELRDALIERKHTRPSIRILVITDPINDVYGGAPSELLQSLREAGIDVVVTDLDALRDSNFLYSSLWRLAVRWWSGDSGGEGWLPNPLESGPSEVTARAWARLANFKANHRKVVIADDGKGGLAGVVSSANPHDASSAHSNVAIRLSGPVLLPLLASEMEIARFSGWEGVIGAPQPAGASASETGSDGPGDNTGARVRLLTEGAIRDAMIDRINLTARGDSIDIAMFYISDRAIIESLLAASRRGAAVRLILDPNKDAFGRTKNGIPNRPAASELVAASDGAIRVRWYRTHGEQFHTKLVMVYDREHLWFTLGSANLTRRNLGDYNLEANVAAEVQRGSDTAVQLVQYFDTLWDNRAPMGIEYTADFGVYSDPAQSRYWLYRIMEATGLSTF